MTLTVLIIRNELKMLVRSRLQLSAILLFVFLGIYSIYYGHTELSRQKEKIIQVTDSIHVAQREYQALLKVDTVSSAGKYSYEMAALPSLVRFNYNFLAANNPSPLAALSLGQRDLYPSFYVLNAQNLYTQTLKGDIYNPFKLSAGNFDLAFVMVYLMPLLIIALGFDVLSAEKDLGTYTLLRTTVYPLRKILAVKLIFRYLLAALVAVFLSIAGFFVSGAFSRELISGMFFWVLTLLLYNALWFSLISFINSLNKSTSFNASAAIGAWIILLIILPSLFNLAAESKKQPSAITLAGLMRSRNMPETDSAMNKALTDLYVYYPSLKPADTVKTPFFYFQGYSAFLAVDQIRSKLLVDSFYASVRNRSAGVQLFNIISPAVNTQDLLNSLASTDLETELDFKSAIEQFHRQIFWFSNLPLFKNQLMTDADYSKQPVFRFRHEDLPFKRLITGILQLVILSICFSWLAARNLSEEKLYIR